jgi:hypothetical protein
MAGFLVAKLVSDHQRARAQSGHFRARRRWFRDAEQQAGDVTISKSALAELRDALTGAPLVTDAELFRCAQCQSFYGVDSVRALAQDNAARCVSCGSTKRLPVHVEE